MTGALYAAAGSDPALLVEVAREFSPRIEVCGPREITLDLSGLARLFGDARAIAAEMRRTAADRGLQVRIAIAGTRTAARLLVRHRAGVTVVEPGDEASALAPLPLALLTDLRQPGLKTRRHVSRRLMGPDSARCRWPGLQTRPKRPTSPPPSAAGACARLATSRRCRPTT